MVPVAKKQSITQRIAASRLWVQIAFLAVWLDPLALRFHGVCAPVFHCYACPLATFACPVGVLAHFSALHIIPFLALGIIILTASVFGTFICGYACPFGFLQDLASKVPTPKLSLPRWTGLFRYIILLACVLLIPYFLGDDHPLFICSICPAGALEAALPNVITQATANEPITWPNPIKLTILAAFLITIFFIHRPWCRLLCPLGAILGLFNRVSVFFLRRDTDSCTACGICEKQCDLDLNPTKDPNPTACVRCLDCTTCPPKSISITHPLSKK